MGGGDERLHQRAQLGLDHLASLTLDAAQVALEGVDPAPAPARLLVDVLAGRLHLRQFHHEEEVVGELLKDRRELGVVEREQLLEAARRVPTLRNVACAEMYMLRQITGRP